MYAVFSGNSRVRDLSTPMNIPDSVSTSRKGGLKIARSVSALESHPRNHGRSIVASNLRRMYTRACHVRAKPSIRYHRDLHSDEIFFRDCNAAAF